LLIIKSKTTAASFAFAFARILLQNKTEGLILAIMLLERILILKEKSHNKIWGKSSNPIFNLFSDEKCKEIDCLSKENPVIRKQRQTMLDLLKEDSTEVSKKHEECFTLYNEIQAFNLLSAKDESVMFVPKSEIQRIATPDFSKKCGSGKTVNVELKTLSFKGSISNFKRIQKEMDATDHENPQWLYTSAFGYDQKEMESNTRRTVIEQLSARIIAHYQKRAFAQVSFNGNPGILLIDTILLEQTLPIYLQDSLPAYFLDCCYSGSLWNSVFGKMEDRIFQCVRQSANIKHNSMPSEGQLLRRNGIMVEINSLHAIIFIVRTVHKNEVGQIIGFTRSNLDQPEIIECANNFCDFHNDEINSNPNNIKSDVGLFGSATRQTGFTR
jgi:hypothetical protein